MTCSPSTVLVDGEHAPERVCAHARVRVCLAWHKVAHRLDVLVFHAVARVHALQIVNGNLTFFGVKSNIKVLVN